MTGATLGLIGVGSIGRRVAQMAAGGPPNGAYELADALAPKRDNLRLLVAAGELFMTRREEPLEATS